MAAIVYNVAKTKFSNGTLDWDNAGTDIRVLLIEGTVGAGATNPDSATLTAALTGSTEATGTGYVRKTTSNRSATQDDTNNRAVLTADPLTWTGADWGSADAAIVYLHVDGTNGNDIPISFHDGGFPQTMNGGSFTLNWAGGSNDQVLYLT